MDTLFEVLRVAVSLGAVFGALVFLRRWLTKGRLAKPKAKTITVVAKQGLGAKTGVAVVEVGDRRYLLGVTEHAVSLIDRLDAEAVTETLVEMVATGSTPLPPFQRELDAAAAALQAPGPAPDPHPALAMRSVRRVETTPVRLAAPEQVIVPASRRQARDLERAAAAAKPKSSPIAGSILSPDTWRQTAAVLRGQR